MNKTEAIQGERALFEPYMKSRGLDVVSRLETGGAFYVSSFTRHAWDVWQARALVAPAPAPGPVADCGPNPVIWTDSDVARLDLSLNKMYGTLIPAPGPVMTRYERAALKYPNSPGNILAPWARLQCADAEIADLRAALAAQPAASEPVAWRAHRRAKGTPSICNYDGPALFQKKDMAEGCVQEAIDFGGWNGAWVEGLYVAQPAPVSTSTYRSMAEECRKLTEKLNTYRDKLTESEEARHELLRLLNEEAGGRSFMGEPALKAQPEPQAPDAPVAHDDDAAIDRFAAAMKAKMESQRAKGYGGWDDPEQCTDQSLADKLMMHTKKGDPVDVANFAMMLHQRNADEVESAVLTLRGASLDFAVRIGRVAAPLPAEQAEDFPEHPSFKKYGHTWTAAESSVIRAYALAARQAPDAARDAARLAYVNEKHVMGASYAGLGSVNVVVHLDDYQVGGAIYAVDCMIEREQGNTAIAQEKSK